MADSFDTDRKQRMMALTHYGGTPPKCACCGEDRAEFLSIDHVDGSGAKHRLEMGSNGGTRIYRWLYKNNYPSGFRVLCHNCNFAFGHYGYCPHKGVDDSIWKVALIKEEEEFVESFETVNGGLQVSYIMKDLDGRKYVVDENGAKHRIP